MAGNEARYVNQCIDSNWISSGGPFVEKFEQAFARAMGCAHGVACSSGTAALHLALATRDLQPGDEVIVPAFTMIATANAVRYTGATPVFVDSSPRDWNLDPEQLRGVITSRTRGIVVVHTYGQPVDMDAVHALAQERGLFVLEDAAEAHGAIYRGRRVGSLADAAVFSFYGNKIITTGEGGMVTTNDARLAEVARRLRGHAFSSERHFWHQYQGFNYRMTNLQAAIGLAQTERLDEMVAHRREVRAWYDEGLRGVPGLVLPTETPETINVFWVYGLLIDPAFGLERDAVREALARRGIETRTFFVPLHLQPIYFRAWRGHSFPVAEDLGRRGLYLPSGAALTRHEVDYVARELAALSVGGKPSSV